MPRGGKRVASSTRAGLVLSVGRLHRLLRTGNYADRTSMNASVYLAGVLESVATTIFTEAAKEASGRRITPQVLNMVIKRHPDLDALFGHAVLPSGGVIPYIHPNLAEIRKPKLSEFKPAITD